jgi:transcriptional regulator with XRE-family HTH domain
MNIEKTLNSSGERLRRARILAGISTRREFEEKYSISANTLQGWEQGKNPLSQKGARRIISALKQEGLICTTEWLIDGSGMPPRPFETINAGIRKELHTDSPTMENNLREEEAIYKEVQLFRQNAPNSIVLTVSDDSMEPYFKVGDYIGGIQIINADIENYVGKICIIELENNLILPRYLQKGKSINRYTASCTNPNATSSPLNIYNTKVISAAPVVWQRRKIASLK